MPVEAVEWELVKDTGWTLEYIDSLPLERLYQWLQIRDGRAKASQSMRKRDGRKGR